MTYGIGIIIDIHAANGSQNGYDHSAPVVISGNGQQSWDSTTQPSPSYSAQAVTLVTTLVKRYSASPALLGFSLLNEPTVGSCYPRCAPFLPNLFHPHHRLDVYSVSRMPASERLLRAANPYGHWSSLHTCLYRSHIGMCAGYLLRISDGKSAFPHQGRMPPVQTLPRQDCQPHRTACSFCMRCSGLHRSNDKLWVVSQVNNLTTLQGYYRSAYSAVRASCPACYVFIAPRTWEQDTGPDTESATPSSWQTYMRPAQGYNKVLLDLHKCAQHPAILLPAVLEETLLHMQNGPAKQSTIRAKDRACT